MPVERVDSAIGILIGAVPWAVVDEIERAMEEFRQGFARWDGATFDSEGLVLLGRMRVNEEQGEFFIVVRYHYRRGGWTDQLRHHVNSYLDRLALGGYLYTDGRSRFLASVAN